MANPLLKTLTTKDIAILSMIFFGVAIFNSNYAYLQSLISYQEQSNVLNDIIFDDFGNIWSIIQEIVFLIIAFMYLKHRHFDFKQLNFNINYTTPIKIVIYFLVAGLVATGVEYGIYWLQYLLNPPIIHETDIYDMATYKMAIYETSITSYETSITSQNNTELIDYNTLSYITPTLIVFALLNGFFEELFFVGLIFATPKKALHHMLMISLFIRFSFHTYQGLTSALVITTLGIVFILFRQKDDELVPFMLAHSLFDIFGLRLPLFLFDE